MNPSLVWSTNEGRLTSVGSWTILSSRLRTSPPFVAGHASGLARSPRQDRPLDLQESIATTVERPVVAVFEAIGELSLLLSRTFAHVLTGRISGSETLGQMAVNGVNSLPIVLLTMGFSGMVLSLHTANQLH